MFSALQAKQVRPQRLSLRWAVSGPEEQKSSLRVAGMTQTFMSTLPKVVGVSSLVQQLSKVGALGQWRCGARRCPCGLVTAATAPAIPPTHESSRARSTGGAVRGLFRGLVLRSPQLRLLSCSLAGARSWAGLGPIFPAMWGFLPNAGGKSGFSSCGGDIGGLWVGSSTATRDK